MVIQPIFIALLFIGLVIASWRDVKTREVPDMISYSLITIGLIGGLGVALLTQDLMFFLERLFGFLFGLGIGLGMYYARQWGGGDAKLLMGVSAIIGLSLENTSAIEYVVLLILCGAAYGIVWTVYLALANWKVFIAAFKKKIRTRFVHRLRITLVGAGLLMLLLILLVPLPAKIAIGFVLLGFYLLAYSWIFVKTIEESVMIKEYPASRLTEGDWIAQDVKHGGKVIVAKNTPGITIHEIRKIKKLKIRSVKVREGIPFVPSFLLALIALVVLQQIFGIDNALMLLF